MKKVIQGVIAATGVVGLGAGAGLGVLAVLLLAIVLKPLLAVLIGWVVGKVLAVVLGGFIANALTALTGHAVAVSSLPYIVAGLSFVASFFKHSASVEKKPSTKASTPKE